MEDLARREQEFQDEYHDESGDRRVWISHREDEDARYEQGLPTGWFSFKKLWLFMGPGFLMSIAYLVHKFHFSVSLLLLCLYQVSQQVPTTRMRDSCPFLYCSQLTMLRGQAL